MQTSNSVLNPTCWLWWRGARVPCRQIFSHFKPWKALKAEPSRSKLRIPSSTYLIKGNSAFPLVYLIKTDRINWDLLLLYQSKTLVCVFSRSYQRSKAWGVSRNSRWIQDKILPLTQTQWLRSPRSPKVHPKVWKGLRPPAHRPAADRLQLLLVAQRLGWPISLRPARCWEICGHPATETSWISCPPQLSVHMQLAFVRKMSGNFVIMYEAQPKKNWQSPLLSSSLIKNR